MGKYEEYQRHANECLENGHKALNDERRASWLRLAREWLAMIPDTYGRLSKERAFAQHVQMDGTGQEDSTASH